MPSLRRVRVGCSGRSQVHDMNLKLPTIKVKVKDVFPFLHVYP
jgi:hypothetical protein